MEWTLIAALGIVGYIFPEWCVALGGSEHRYAPWLQNLLSSVAGILIALYIVYC